MAKDGEEKGSRSIRALEVVEALVNEGRPMSAARLADATGLPKATVHRLVALLIETGFVTPVPTGEGLGVGPRLRDLAMATVAVDMDHSQRHRILSDLSHEIGETCNFNIPIGGEMYYIDRVETKWPLRTQLPVGSRVPLHCTASGKMYLAMLPAGRRRQIIQSIDLVPHTPGTITDPAQLLANLEQIRREKVGTDNQEFIEGMVAVAVPVTDAKGRLAGTLACHGPTVRMTMETARSFVPALRRAAEKLSGVGGELIED
ncbi:MAG: IclR family transcriptional regulator [Rhodospirillales bacterium]